MVLVRILLMWSAAQRYRSTRLGPSTAGTGVRELSGLCLHREPGFLMSDVLAQRPTAIRTRRHRPRRRWASHRRHR
jgi:hypothetical protein